MGAMTPSAAIQHLQATGLTESAIAAKVHTRQSTINKIKRGVTAPSWQLGAALIELAERTPLPDSGDKKAA